MSKPDHVAPGSTASAPDPAAVVALAPMPAPRFPAPWRAFSPSAWRTWFRATSARIEDAHLERNLGTIAPHVRAGARVLDIGAWDCRLAAALRDRHGARVLCVDVVDRNRTDVELRLLRGATVPVDDERFDVVILLYVLHHAPDDLALLREARRVLAPGGIVLVAEDRADSFGQRAVTVGFHVWLRIFAGMGWKGSFRAASAWRARFADAGLRPRETIDLGSAGRLFPKNVLFVLEASPPGDAAPAS